MSKDAAVGDSAQPQGHNFGTFGGVFTPSILTIFGLIMFMRTGLVVGQVGLISALIILLISHSITIATGLSISAISTNTPVKGGGAYFLISRALGPGFGSSIGVTLFFAQALSVPFYILGFAEAIATNFPALAPYFFFIAVVPGIVLFILSWVGTGWAIKLQYGILTILGLAIATFLLGLLFRPFSFSTLVDHLHPDPENHPPFFVYFAIFFPAVTGIMAGVNMSGDLKDPAKSIPKGTLLAIFVGMMVYGIQMVLTAGSLSRPEMIESPYGSLVENALFGAGILVTAGVICATLSSALGSFLGAPRVLQALAQDRILKVFNPFAKGSGPHNEPRRALLLTFVITLAILIWGGMKGCCEDSGADPLNMIAAVVSMFFLYAYGMVNLAAFVESYGHNPSFRPRFRFYHWTTALFGAAACILVTFLINETASLFALVIIIILFVRARNRELEIAFGDARRGFVYSRIRNNLFQLDKMPPDPKNWRPTIAVLTGNPNTRFNLLQYARLFECNCGILSMVQILVGDYRDLGERRDEVEEDVANFIAGSNLQIFSEVVVAKDFDSGLMTFLQTHSIGPIKPNIVMLGWPNNEQRIRPYAIHLHSIQELDKSCVIMVNPEDRIVPQFAQGHVDVWWRGMRNGSLMLILAYLLTMNSNWARARIRIMRTVQNEDERKDAEDEMHNLIAAARMKASIKVIVSDADFDTIFRRESEDATCIFMGFVPPKPEKAADFFHRTNKQLAEMPTTFLVASSGQADLLA